MMKSKFNEAYLQIIKESYDGFAPAETDTDTDVTENSTEMKQVCFKTTDATLIDALNSGFENVTISVNCKDETTGEDTVTEVKFGKDSFGELTITDVEDAVETEEDENIGEDAEGEESEESEDDAVETEEDENIEEDAEGEDAEGEESEKGDDIAVECGEWIEDGVCVKCQSPECDGSCKCEKCGDVNCIGDCKDEVTEEDITGAVGGGLVGAAVGGPVGAVGGAILGSKL